MDPAAIALVSQAAAAAAAAFAGAPPPGGAPDPAVLQAAVQHAIAAALAALPAAGGAPPPPPPPLGAPPPPPGPPPPPPPPPLTTYHTLVEEAALEDHHTAKLMAETFRDTTWPVALQPFMDAEVRADPVGNGNAYMRHMMDANALAPKYFLMISDNIVHVAYGLSPCPHMTSPGVRAFWLSGDYTMMAAGVLVHPKLYRSAGDILTQVANFERVEVPAAELVDILAAYDADEALRLAPALARQGVQRHPHSMCGKLSPPIRKSPVFL